MERKFADIHTHPILKPFNNRNYPEGYGKTIWDNFDERKKDLKKLSFIIKWMARELAKASQANLDACVEAKLVCPFLALYPVERQWFDVRPNYSWIRFILPKRKYHYLGSAASGFPAEYVKKIMSRIKEREGIDYFNEELLPLLHYTLDQTKTNSKNYPYYSFRIATNYEEFDMYTKSDNIICGIITIEGGNSLGNYQSHSIFYKEFEDLSRIEQDQLREDFIRNIDALKAWKDGSYTPFFISFCHHFNNLLAGHSKSLGNFKLLLDQEPGLNKEINKMGFEIIKHLLSRENGRRILIDTKHMSVQSRMDYHSFVKEVNKSEDPKEKIPIIQSHAAISGWASLKKAISQDEDNNIDENTYFSRWKVNLEDDEILDIYDSDGIIGIVFHEDRMPGGSLKSRIKKINLFYHYLNRKELLSARQQRIYDRKKEKLKMIYIELLWSNIFHIIKLIHDKRDKAEDGWKIISIGSDYDGMIDPFDGYSSVRDLPKLFSEMMEYIDNDKGPIYFGDKGTIHKFHRNEIETLMFGKKIEDILSDICFNNVKTFLSKYFTDDYLKNNQ
jgi:microsomal dipeptidase-like Zn-dependent dipeptidase